MHLDNKRLWQKIRRGRVRLIPILLLSLAMMNISCGSQPRGEYPPAEVDKQKLEEVLASRQQENPPPLTLLEAYQIALDKAREWGEGAYPIYMKSIATSLEEPYSYKFGALNPSGIGCLNHDSEVAGAYIDVDRFSGEVVGLYDLGGGGFDTSPIEDIEDWIIDSPEAIAISERAGGKAFKDKYPEYKMIIETTTLFPPAEWVIEYWVSDGKGQGEKSIVASFRITIDPHDGSCRIINNTDGVSGQVIAR